LFMWDEPVTHVKLVFRSIFFDGFFIAIHVTFILMLPRP